MTAQAIGFGTPIFAAAVAAPRRARPGLRPGRRRSLVHSTALAVVWLALALSGLVLVEPAPVDALLVGLVVLLPLIGLATLADGIAGLLVLWLAVAAAGLLSAGFAADAARATAHTLITLYLSVASVVLAAFVAKSPAAHARIIFSGCVAAAVVATLAGIIGYFGLLPGAHALFTKFGRAAGTFKDPNVFGAFLVAPLLYCLHLALEASPRRAVLPLLGAGMLAAGVLLSFSRGAWVNLALAVSVFCCLSFVLAPTAVARARVAGAAACTALLLLILVGLAVQIETVADLVSERATLTQSYDVGPEGRFGGQEKALRLIAEHPLGIGAQEFAQSHHHEEAHNVYLSMALNAGWLGGGLFVLINLLTLAVGLRGLTTCRAVRPLLIVAIAAFLATALEGLIVDTDHWRHLFVEMALVWGLAVAPGASADSRQGPSS